MFTILILNIIILIMGLYLLYVSINMKKEGKIDPLILTKEEIAKCKDEKAYVDYVYPVILTLAIVSCVCGLADVVITVFKLWHYATYFPMGLFLIVFFIFIGRLSSARKEYII